MSEEEIESGRQKIRDLAVSTSDKLGPLSDIEFGFNRASVQWVEGFIERLRQQSLPGESHSGLIGSLGSFLGECIVEATNGKWNWSTQEETWGVLFPVGAWAFPYAKVSKQFENGVEGGDSVASFYDVTVNYVATGQLGHKS